MCLQHIYAHSKIWLLISVRLVLHSYLHWIYTVPNCQNQEQTVQLFLLASMGWGVNNFWMSKCWLIFDGNFRKFSTNIRLVFIHKSRKEMGKGYISVFSRVNNIQCQTSSFFFIQVYSLKASSCSDFSNGLPEFHRTGLISKASRTIRKIAVWDCNESAMEHVFLNNGVHLKLLACSRQSPWPAETEHRCLWGSRTHRV